MTKAEKIKEAYGVHWKTVKNNINADGWIEAINDEPIFSPSLGELEEHIKEFWFRPISLRGIEDNNGWNFYNYEELPKDMDCHVINPEGDIVVLSTNVINSISKNSLANITHYKIIEKPQPPIY